MSSVWGWALFSPHGRESDWFPSESACPVPRRIRGYTTRQVERSRAYIGEMGEGEAKRLFALADMVLRGPEHAQERGPQARLRSRIAMKHLDDFADVPHRDPTP